jgi:hypothetical protein
VKVVIFDHVVRCAPKAQRGENGVREPAKVVHNDYSLKSGPRRVRDHVPEEAEELLQHRVAEINVWRAIRGPIQESPLAVCDAQSIELRDVVASDLVYPHRVGETMASARRREAEDPVGNRIFMDSYSFSHTAYRYRTWGKNDERYDIAAEYLEVCYWLWEANC